MKRTVIVRIVGPWLALTLAGCGGLPLVGGGGSNAPLDVPDSGQLAATYLRRFAGAADWAHMDIGSSAYLEQEFAPWPKGATASPMLTLLQLMLDQGQTKHDDT